MLYFPPSLALYTNSSRHWGDTVQPGTVDRPGGVSLWTVATRAFTAVAALSLCSHAALGQEAETPDRDAWTLCANAADPVTDNGAIFRVLGSIVNPTGYDNRFDLGQTRRMATGPQAIAACRTALQEEGAAKFPTRRANLRLALAMHLLVESERTGAQPDAVLAAIAEYRADVAARQRAPVERLLMDSWADILAALALSRRDGAEAARLLLGVTERAPFSPGLMLVAANTALAPTIPNTARIEIWARFARVDPQVAASVRGLREATSFPFLPPRTDIVDSVLTRLEAELSPLGFSDRFPVSGSGGDLSQAGHSVVGRSQDGRSLLVRYPIRPASPDWTIASTILGALLEAEKAGVEQVVIGRLSLSIAMIQYSAGGPQFPHHYVGQATVRFGRGGPADVAGDEYRMPVGPTLAIARAAGVLPPREGS